MCDTPRNPCGLLQLGALVAAMGDGVRYWKRQGNNLQSPQQSALKIGRNWESLTVQTAVPIATETPDISKWHSLGDIEEVKSIMSSRELQGPSSLC